MAIKILNEIPTPSGLNVANLEATYSGRYVLRRIRKDGGKLYEVSSNVSYYHDRSKSQLFDEKVIIQFPEEEINNVWLLLYNYLKTKYPQYENVAE
jgi:hypothetical protein